MTEQRKLPYDVDMEQALLGCLLVDESQYWPISDHIAERDFYDPVHQKMFTAIANIASKGGAATPLTVASAFGENDPQFNEVGGRKYLVALARAAPAMGNVKGYAQILRGLARRRSLIQIANDIATAAFDEPDGDPVRLADDAAQALYDATHGDDPGEGPLSLFDLSHRALKDAERAFSNPKDVCLTSGLSSVDEALGMLFRGDLMVLGASTSQGKALALDTPIPTPSGWTTMGALNVGDIVFGSDGHPARITAMSDVMHGRPCYRVSFSDGSEIVADAEHRWFTTTVGERERELSHSHRYLANERARRAARRKPPQRPWLCERNAKLAENKRSDQSPNRKYGDIRTTVEIAATLIAKKSGAERFNHHIPNTFPLILPDAELPLDPYLLGAWLGDGTTAKAHITCGQEDLNHFIEQVSRTGTRYDVKRDRNAFTIILRPDAVGPHKRQPTLKPYFQEIGILGHKHIPHVYLRSSFDQRLALLQGLMDTDGCCDRAGIMEFTTCSEEIANGIIELLHSLGVKTRQHWHDATLYGRIVNRKCRITFCLQFPAFRLKRKLERQKFEPNRRCLARGIVAIKRIASVPVKCIAVDNESHLFLAGRSMIPTHNTALVQKMLRANVDRGHAVLMYSLEMRGEQIATRYMAQDSQIASNRIRQGNISPGEFDRLTRAPNAFHGIGNRFKIDSTQGLSVAQMRARALAYRRKEPGLALIVADHLQYIRAADPRATMDEQARQITRDLCALAKELDVAMVLISHLTKENERRTSKKPIMSDLYGSGGIAQNADSVWFLYRHHYYLMRDEPEKTDTKAHDQWERDCDRLKGKAEIYSTKARMGSISDVQVGFDEVFTRFYDLNPTNVSAVSEQESLALTER